MGTKLGLLNLLRLRFPFHVEVPGVTKDSDRLVGWLVGWLKHEKLAYYVRTGDAMSPWVRLRKEAAAAQGLSSGGRSPTSDLPAHTGRV